MKSEKGKIYFGLALGVVLLILCNNRHNGDFKLAKNNKSNNQNVNGSAIVCILFVGGLGNNIFQFASAYGISRSVNRKLVIPRSSRVARIFKINVTLSNIDTYCKRLPHVKERNELFATYDDKMLGLNKSGDVRLGMYLQSWKYFINSQNELKKQLQFRAYIKKEAEDIMKNILKNKRNGSFTIIGIHVRRGDMVNNKFGFQVATQEYLLRSITFYKNRFQNLTFIVASNDIPWCKYHLPNDSSIVYIHNKPEVDMAVLSKCDHMIMTVGTYGWWAAWLSGGNVTYYKYPAREGSWWDKKMSIVDHFPPNWIGL